jgi:hypothetical protein
VTGLWGAGVPHRAGLVVPLVAAGAIAAFAFGFSERRTAQLFSAQGATSGAAGEDGGGFSLSEAASTPNAG